MNIIILFVAFFMMEFVAWFTHKFIMHGLLWYLHNDHHVKGEGHFFERNDYFFLIFAIPGILLLLFGTFNNFDYRFWLGAGITCYGLAYFFVHDIFIHQRFKIFRNSDNFYLRALRKAHKVHHKSMVKEGGQCFGMLIVPLKYLREAIRLEVK